MSELKPDWTRVKFGEVVRQVKERVDPADPGLERFVAGEHMDTDDLRIRRWGEIGDGYLGPAFHARFRPGHVLYGSRRTYLRKVAVADFDGVCANTTFVLESAARDVLLPELLPFLMQTEMFHAHSRRESKGSVNPYVNFSDLAWYEFALPPLVEQKRIVALLSVSTELVNVANQLVEAAKSTRDASLASFVSGGASWSLTTESVQSIDLPEAWTTVRMDEICTAPVTSGTTPASGRVQVETQYPFIRVQNLTFDGTLNFLESPEWLEGDAFLSSPSRHVLPGDILINIVGPPLGKVSIVPHGFPTAMINQAIVRYRINEPNLRIFVLGYLMSRWAKHWLLLHSTKTSGQRNINSSTAAALPIALPPLDQLASLSTQVLAAVRLPEVAERNLARNRLFHSQLLKKCLAGDAGNTAGALP
jgi:type I restriction enzyme S subunit